MKYNREGADVVGELGGENARVMAKGTMSGGVEVRKGVGTRGMVVKEVMEKGKIL